MADLDLAELRRLLGLDDVLCPSCLTACEITEGTDEDDAGATITWLNATCPECGYEMDPDGVLTVRQMLDPAITTGPTWNDVDLPAWTRRIAAHYRALLDRLEAAEVWDYGARVGLHNDLSYAEGTVVGYDLHRRRYKVEVDGYGRTEWVPRSQLRPLPPLSAAVPGAVAGEPESTPAASVGTPAAEPMGVQGWIGQYLSAQKRFEGVCVAVLTKIADGGEAAQVIDVVGEWMDGCDCLDDEVIALFHRAARSAAGGASADTREAHDA